MTNNDLIETLINAACAAIRNQSTAIVDDVGQLRSITLELEIANSGQVIDSTAWIERRGVHRAGRSA